MFKGMPVYMYSPDQPVLTVLQKKIMDRSCNGNPSILQFIRHYSKSDLSTTSWEILRGFPGFSHVVESLLDGRATRK